MTERITGEAPEALRFIRAEKAKRSLLEFVRQAWMFIEPGMGFVEGWHHSAICEHLEAVSRGELRKLVISVPPEHSKSTCVAKCWPAWGWVNNPSFDWLFSSYSAQRAVGDSVDCRRIIDSYWYRKNWAHIFHLTSDQNQKTRFTNSKGGQRISMGLLGAGTGEHADAVVCDDPHSIRDQWSPKRLEAAMQTWDQVMTRCINDPKTSRHVIIMQRLHHKDLAAHCLKQGGYEYLCLPTEHDPLRSKVTSIGWKDPRKKKGELLWPGRFGIAEVKDAKTRLGARGFSSQHQQNPTQEEGAIFKREKFKYYANDPRKIAGQMDQVIQSWDMAFKDLESGSKVAGHVWGRKGADRFLLDRECEHLDFTQSIEAVEKMSERWPMATAKIIEDKANGPAVINSLARKVTGLIPWPPKGQPMGSKIARAYASQPEVEAGNVWLPDPNMHPWVPEFVEYCVAFPGGEYDDDIDAMTQALERFRSILIIEADGKDIFAVGTGRSYWKRVS
jgi:predicted phage terminase large subunit-like protein